MTDKLQMQTPQTMKSEIHLITQSGAKIIEQSDPQLIENSFSIPIGYDSINPGKFTTKEVELQAKALENRVNLLEQQEKAILKKIEQTKQKAKKIIQLKNKRKKELSHKETIAKKRQKELNRRKKAVKKMKEERKKKLKETKKNRKIANQEKAKKVKQRMQQLKRRHKKEMRELQIENMKTISQIREFKRSVSAKRTMRLEVIREKSRKRRSFQAAKVGSHLKRINRLKLLERKTLDRLSTTRDRLKKGRDESDGLSKSAYVRRTRRGSRPRQGSLGRKTSRDSQNTRRKSGEELPVGL